MAADHHLVLTWIVYCVILQAIGSAATEKVDRRDWEWQGGSDTWDQIPSSVCPLGCLCVDKGSDVACPGASLPRVPTILSTVISLDLSDNLINILYNDSFNQAQYLQTISIENNVLIHIEAGAFVPLGQLRELRLARNHLSFLPRDLFWNNVNLELLDLSHNAFVEIPDGVMYPLHNLEVLNMSFNGLSTAGLGPGFKYTTQLSLLDLTGNNLLSVGATAFSVTEWWDDQVPHYLNMSSCNIRHIHPNALSKLTRLQYLDFSGNDKLPHGDLNIALQDLDVTYLQTLDLSFMNLSSLGDMFARFQHRHLHHLDVSHNNIRTIPSRCFYYLVQLRTLDLSFNKLTVIGDLSGLSHLQHLHISHNYIRELDTMTFESLPTLRILDMSHNTLTSIQQQPFENFWDLHTLNLQSNQIQEFSISSGLESLETLDLSDNMLTDVTSLKRLLQLRTVDMSSNLITRLHQGVFSRGHSLHLVNLSRNIITDIHPQAFYSSTQDILDLSLNKISHLSHCGWRRLKELHLQGNMIMNISAGSFVGLTAMSVLNLADNNLHVLPEGVFRDNFNLRQLSLDFNPIGAFLQTSYPGGKTLNLLWKLETLEMSHVGLQTLPQDIFSNITLLKHLNLNGNRLRESDIEHLEHLHRLNTLQIADNLLQFPSPDLFRLPRLRTLDISQNPYHCTCELLPFRNWLMDTDNVSVMHVHEPAAYLCASPPEWQGASLREFHLASRGHCTNHERAVVIASIVCSAFVVAMCATLVAFRFRPRGCLGKKKSLRTHYSVIDNEHQAVQLNPHTNIENRDWV